ncbi:hypothetical protein [Variovorax boronicumulans]|uniref:hypothetical protein n=1 Tax=Variovorax boronicumulans TaxID=436515 RepID=UPI0027818CE3|nr:hypothetical protein [Variovorax boronicumulans]MDQ0040837.1 hypothetical protein [Variovorax boronicumulans]
MSETLDKPEVEERLSSNPRDKLLIAAALAPKAVGRRLIMLHGEWDGCAKPLRPQEHHVEALYRAMPRLRPSAFCINQAAMDAHYVQEPKKRKEAAKAEAERWYTSERLRVISCLKSLPGARDGLEEAAKLKGIENTRAKVLSVLAWWLDPVCPICSGRKYTTASGTNRLSNRVCPQPEKGGCGGSGERHLPHGKDGRVIEALMIDYIHRARQQINSLERGYTAVQWNKDKFKVRSPEE